MDRSGVAVETVKHRHISRNVMPRAVVVASVAGAVAVGLMPFQPAHAAAPIPPGSIVPTVTGRSQSWIAPGQSQSFFAAMLAAIGAPASNANLQVMQAWAAAEGSYLAFNPWNTTQRAPGSIKDKNGSTKFADAASAITATSRQLLSLYPAVVAGFRVSDPNQTIAAIVASPWAGGHYYGKNNYLVSTIWRAFVSISTGWVRVIPGSGVPDVVPSLRVSNGVSRVTLHWKAANSNGSAITRYQVGVRRIKASGLSWRAWVYKTTSKNARSATWVGLMHGKRHQVIVRARNGQGWGQWSNVMRARP